MTSPEVKAARLIAAAFEAYADALEDLQQHEKATRRRDDPPRKVDIQPLITGPGKW